MPRKETSRLKLSNGWVRGEDWWGDPISDNFTYIDMLLHPFVLSITESSPPLPLAQKVGDMYIIAPGGEGDWEGHDNDMAIVTEKGWVFFTPTRGVRVGVSGLSWYWFDGTVWAGEKTIAGVQPPPVGERYDIAVSVGYEAEPMEVILVYAIPEAMTLTDGAPGSLGRSVFAPSAMMALSIKRNGAEVGTITFNPGSVVPVFDVNGDKTFATGDLLAIQMPVSPPEGFENFSVTLRLALNRSGG